MLHRSGTRFTLMIFTSDGVQVFRCYEAPLSASTAREMSLLSFHRTTNYIQARSISVHYAFTADRTYSSSPALNRKLASVRHVG